MSPATEQVYQAALSLPPSDRFELVQALLAAEQTPPPLDESWRTLVPQRSAEWDSGAVTPLPWSEVRVAMRRQVGRDG
jgi:putative addiction module component (TIGR02574 family)